LRKPSVPPPITTAFLLFTLRSTIN